QRATRARAESGGPPNSRSSSIARIVPTSISCAIGKPSPPLLTSRVCAASTGPTFAAAPSLSATRCQRMRIRFATRGCFRRSSKSPLPSVRSGPDDAVPPTRDLHRSPRDGRPIPSAAAAALGKLLPDRFRSVGRYHLDEVVAGGDWVARRAVVAVHAAVGPGADHDAHAPVAEAVARVQRVGDHGVGAVPGVVLEALQV